MKNKQSHNPHACGLDFGTSNSSIGYTDSSFLLTDFEGRSYIPSAIFFDLDVNEPFFGTTAIQRYIDGHEGRIIWSPKNALGTSLIDEKTRIKDKMMSFKNIIALIISNLKKSCEQQAGYEMKHVVVGRPVHFSDHDKMLDKRAQEAVEELLKDIGFKDVIFEYEPIAAAVHYEQEIDSEQIALVVDMGGGTSDFTIAKLEPKNNQLIKNYRDRSKDILSVGGIHIAGTDFDKQLSLQSLMPEFGLGCEYKSLEGTWLPVPPTMHRDLATWHKIGLQYNNQNISFVKSKIYSSNCPEKFQRLLTLLQKNLGHYFAKLVEKSKIELSNNSQTSLISQEVEPTIQCEITQHDFEKAIYIHVQRIAETVSKTIHDAAITPDKINAIFMTGGSSLIPLVRETIIAMMPQAKLIEGDKFGSVALGLTALSQERFTN